jgi:hypothetical protein
MKILIVSLSSLLLLGLVLGLGLRPQQGKEKIKRSATLPVMEYQQEKAEDTINRGKDGVLEWKRRAHYNAPASSSPDANLRSALNPQSKSVCDLPLSHANWGDGLPVDKSDSIIVGRVEKAQAFLSADHTNIFSQFAVNVSRVLKGSDPLPDSNNRTIIVERRGGAVRFPNGAIVERGKCFEKMPMTGKSYLFFLKYQPDTKDFHLLTGYELKGGAVYALDGEMEGGAPIKSFVQHDGGAENQFLDRVASASAQRGGK